MRSSGDRRPCRLLRRRLDLLFGMKEHTHLAFLANTFPLVDTFRRMSVKTCLFSVTLSVIKL